jgi:hypothetical protein
MSIRYVRDKVCMTCGGPCGMNSLYCGPCGHSRGGRTGGFCKTDDPPGWEEHLQRLADRAKARLPLFNYGGVSWPHRDG